MTVGLIIETKGLSLAELQADEIRTIIGGREGGCSL
jgi:hypothetical protein